MTGQKKGLKMDKYYDFPKLDSPFIRADNQGHYVITEEIDLAQSWFTEPGVLAVDKLDGTNIGLYIENGQILKVMNRMNERPLFATKVNKGDIALMEGIVNAIAKEWLVNLPTGWHYGELVGPSINSNHHQLQKHIWVPFGYLKASCSWNSWRDNKYPKDYDSIRTWFQDLFSLFNKKMKLPDVKAEGLVFHHPDGRRMCKLRRDMYLEYYTEWGG